MHMTRRNVAITAIVGIVAVALITWAIVRTSAQKAPGPESRPASEGAAPTVAVTKVVSQDLSREIRLPGELQPFQEVAIYAKVTGFVEWIGVDRGSLVKSGQQLVRMSAPELAAERSEAGAKTRSAQSQRTEAEASSVGASGSEPDGHGSASKRGSERAWKR